MSFDGVQVGARHAAPGDEDALVVRRAGGVDATERVLLTGPGAVLIQRLDRGVVLGAGLGALVTMALCTT